MTSSSSSRSSSSQSQATGSTSSEIQTTQVGQSSLYDPTTNQAFGPVFDSPEDAQDFLVYLNEQGQNDPKLIPTEQLMTLYRGWNAEVEAGSTQSGGSNIEDVNSGSGSGSSESSSETAQSSSRRSSSSI